MIDMTELHKEQKVDEVKLLSLAHFRFPTYVYLIQ